MKDESNSRALDVKSARKSIADTVRTLLSANGVTKRQHYKRVQELTGLKYDAVRRRMLGAAPWGPNELSLIMNAYGQSAMTCYAGVFFSAPLERALLQTEGHSFKCDIWVGPPLDSPPPVPQLVALAPAKAHDLWTVVSSTSVEGGQCHLLSGLFMDNRVPVMCVALLGKIPSALAKFLFNKGVTAEVFNPPTAIAQHLSTNRFDAFIADWASIAEDSTHLLRTLRAINPTHPIVLLVPKALVDNPQVELATRNFEVLLYEPDAHGHILHTVRARSHGFR